MSSGNPAGGLTAEAPREAAPPRFNEKLGICHLLSGDLWAGAEVQVAGLLQALSGRTRLEIVAILLNEGRLAEVLRDSGIEVAVIPETRHGFLEILGQATSYLQSRNIHVVHSHRYKENLLGALLARRCRIPFVVRTEHGRPEPFHGVRMWKHQILQMVDRGLAAWGTDYVVSVSGELKRHLSRYVAPGRIAVIPNALDAERVHSSFSVSEAKLRLSIPEEHPVIGFAGRLVPVKRLDLFLAAAQEIADRVSNCMFVIAGEGSERVRLQQIASASGLADRVLFLGQRSDIYDVLRAFDIFVLSSDHEGLPMVLLEALSTGIAVVARSVGGIPEVIEHGVSGLLLDSADPRLLAGACVQLLENPALRTRLGRAGAARVAAHFAVEPTADQVCHLYESLCVNL